MTFLEFYSAIAEHVFPEGEADNLVLRHKNSVRDAIIDLQMKVPCLRGDNVEHVGQCATEFRCGASVFDTVDGNIEEVYTLKLDDGCDRVDYTYVTWEQMQGLVHKYKCCIPNTGGTSPYYQGISCGNPYGPAPGQPEYAIGSASTDKGFRAMHGTYWTVHRGQIWMFPSLESTEQAVVEWTGTRRTWQDSTTIPETMVDPSVSTEPARDIANAVEYYLQADVDRLETKDLQSMQIHQRAYNDAVANLIWECRKKNSPLRKQDQRAPSAC